MLLALGWTVTIVDDNGITEAQAAGKQLVVISESVTAANVAGTFTNTGVGVLTWEEMLYDDLGLTTSTDWGETSTGQTQVNIMAPSHPLAAGLSGTVAVSSSEDYFWGKPAAAATIAATLTSDATKATSFGYETGAQMVGLTAPARRAGLFFAGTALNTNGWALFDAAVAWAGATPPGVGNGTSGTFAFDNRGRLNAMTWKDPSQSTVTSDAVTRSAAGRVTDQSIDGADPYPSGANFTYDGAGRLTSAQVPGHALTYSFAGSGGCGPLTTAGANTNRTSMVDNSVTTTYCYDEVDRLTSTTATGLGTIAYDAHGNTTTLGSETFAYDGADRHVESTANGTTVRYVRDALGRIVARTVTGAQSQNQRYSYSGGGASASAVLDTNNQVIETTIGLPGGVTLTKRASEEVWSYPNIHGDVAAVANSSGAKQGTTFTYDPYGNTLTATPDNSDGSYDYGWLGQHARGLEHATDLQPVIEMGARQYHPLLGRFLEVDPIEGGSCNDYDYVCGDPVNAFDLTGTVCQKVWYFRVCSPDVAPVKSKSPAPIAPSRKPQPDTRRPTVQDGQLGCKSGYTLMSGGGKATVNSPAYTCVSNSVNTPQERCKVSGGRLCGGPSMWGFVKSFEDIWKCAVGGVGVWATANKYLPGVPGAGAAGAAVGCLGGAVLGHVPRP